MQKAIEYGVSGFCVMFVGLVMAIDGMNPNGRYLATIVAFVGMLFVVHAVYRYGRRTRAPNP